MSSVVERIAADVTVSTQFVEKALALAHVRFRKIRVPKRSGGHRTILQPATELKLIHQWLLVNVLLKVPTSQVATAFCPGASIVKNAATHKDSLYSVRVDLTNFFPSIRSGDLRLAVVAAKTKLPFWALDADVGRLVATACFDQLDRLPIGYPTSPCIANAVMYEFDRALLSRIVTTPSRFGHAALTRYADDFVFSTDKRGACREFVDLIRKVVSTTTSPMLEINEGKTRFMSRPGGSVLVTGLRINQSGIVRVHPSYRDHVRLLLKLFSQGSLKLEEHQRLRGHLAFVEHADPGLFTRLSFRYYDEIARLRGR